LNRSASRRPSADRAATGRRAFIPRLAALLALLPAACGSAAPVQVPDLTLKTVAGHEVRLSDFRGKILLVDFWATWCGPCKETIPDLVKLQTRHKGHGVEVIGISLDVQGPQAVSAFMKQYKMNYTVLLGNDGVAKAFGGIVGIPTSFVVDRQGRIVKRFIGVVDAAAYEDVIRSLP
jgi:thiol-disulfide isomerase/thioredoxin